MDQQLLRSLGIEGDLDVDSSTTKGGPGKSTLTSKLTPAPQVVFRVADPETARALGESFGSGSRPRIQREADASADARDGNGVMAGAEVAVDRAASSSGAPLPTHIQRQFEGSLGADLSGVRVHTGSESQEAAHAVGAKAYTVGNDIHFAAGKYQPDDPFGMHLLAHEVAHTVQQSGGAQRRQHKLEVSTPQDSAEHEADRAADAMVRGEAATVNGASGVSRQVLQRDGALPFQDVMGNGDEAARINTEAQRKDGAYSFLGGASNVGDREQAATMLRQVNSGIAELEAAQVDDKASDIKAMHSESVAAKTQLETYITASSKQDTMQSHFAQSLSKTNAQYARLEGMFNKAMASYGIKGDDTGNFDADRARRVAVAGSNKTFEENKTVLQDQAAFTGGGTPEHRLVVNQDIAASKAVIKNLTDELGGIPKEIGVAVDGVMASQSKVNAAVQMAELPPPVRQSTEEQAKLKKQISAAKAEFETAVTIINTAASAASTGIGLVPMGGNKGGNQWVDPGAKGANYKTGELGPGTPGYIDDGVKYDYKGNASVHGNLFGTGINGGYEDVPAMVGSGDAALKHAQTIMSKGANVKLDSAIEGQKFGFVEGLASALTNYEAKVNSATGLINAIDDENTKASLRAVQSALLAEKGELGVRIKELRRLKTKHELAIQLLRAETEKLVTKINGNKSGDKKGPDLGLALAFQTEATIFLSDIDTTLEIGAVERKTAKEINPNVETAPEPEAIPATPVPGKPEPQAGSAGITNSANRGAPYWSAYKQPRPDKPDKVYWSYTRNTVYIVEQGAKTQRVLDKNTDVIIKSLAEDKVRVQGFVAKMRDATGI